MAIVKVNHTKGIKKGDKPDVLPSVNEVSLDDQIRLAEILNDSPTVVSFNDTEWEIRALRMGTQILIAEEVSKTMNVTELTFGDIMKELSHNINCVATCIALGLLNDKGKIYKDGIVSNGYSQLYYDTIDTILWDCDITKLGELLVGIFKMIDTSFFLECLAIMDVARQSVLTKKRMRTKEQKSSIQSVK